MTFTSWASLAALVIGGLMVFGSHVACEVRGRDECLRKTAEPLIAVLAGTGLLFTHSPAEGALAAGRAMLARRRRPGASSDPFPPMGPPTVDLVGKLPDPREIYAGGRRG